MCNLQAFFGQESLNRVKDAKIKVPTEDVVGEIISSNLQSLSGERFCHSVHALFSFTVNQDFRGAFCVGSDRHINGKFIVLLQTNKQKSLRLLSE